jgi:hypothetical protein
VVTRLHHEVHTVRFVDNSLGAGNAQLSSYEAIARKANYPSKEELTKRMNEIAKKLYNLPKGAKGKINKEQYEGYIQ